MDTQIIYHLMDMEYYWGGILFNNKRKWATKPQRDEEET